MIRSTVLALSAVLMTAGVVQAQSPADWRQVAPENLLVVDTSKGRVLVELVPDAAPQAVERIRTLAGQGFYDGLTFHRVIRNFMAQTGDPLGTGAGGSDLPDLPAEFTFRRGRAPGFVQVAPAIPQTGSAQDGLFGVLPVRTQPDAQMFVTADNRVDAHVLFCPGVAGMARAQSPDSANSQFFFMTGYTAVLNADYTAFGRVLSGLDVVESLKAGAEADNGSVTDPDTLVTVRLASDLPEGQRPTARVANPGSPAVAQAIEAARAEAGSRFMVCDVDVPVEID